MVTVAAAGMLIPALPDGMMLGSLTGHVDRLARIGKPHVVIGWKLARDGRKLDGPWLVDVSGRYTDEPRDVILNPMDRESPMKGALLPAGPKGFGMLLIVEMLAALLSGERTCRRW